MTLVQGLILGVIVVVVGWIILQPQRWGKRDSGSSSDGDYTTVGVHGRRDHDNDNDGDGGGGGDGGGDGGGGGGD